MIILNTKPMANYLSDKIETTDSNNQRFGYLFLSLDSKVTIELHYASM